jgi:hypothetical protein
MVATSESIAVLLVVSKWLLATSLELG